MSSFEIHYELYENFRRDAKNDTLFAGTRADAYFLSAFHLIDACAARQRQHINNHQKVRHFLERNPAILQDATESAWRSFQRLENQLRPRFVYGASWVPEDLEEMDQVFTHIETLCQEVLNRA
jgi:hypothetical protein